MRKALTLFALVVAGFSLSGCLATAGTFGAGLASTFASRALTDLEDAGDAARAYAGEIVIWNQELREKFKGITRSRIDVLIMDAELAKRQGKTQEAERLYAEAETLIKQASDSLKSINAIGAFGDDDPPDKAKPPKQETERTARKGLE